MCQKETRVAVMGIIVENRDSAGQLNALLHEYGEYIIGRMGIPYKEKSISNTYLVYIINIMRSKYIFRNMFELLKIVCMNSLPYCK